MSNHVDAVGFFTARDRAETAVDALKAAGFQPGAVEVKMPSIAKPFSLQDYALSIFFGILIFATLGLLFSMAVYDVAVVREIPFIGAFPTAFLGLALGTVFGAWFGVYVTRVYEVDLAKQTGTEKPQETILLSVHCPDQISVKKAEEILERTGAKDVRPVFAHA